MYEECKRLSKSYVARESPATIITLDYFIRVYIILSNFVEFLELHGFGSIHCKKIPLQGALEIFNKIKVSSCKDPSKQVIECPGLFANSFHFRFAYCTKSANIPENIVNKIKAIITYLTESSIAKNYSAQTKSILFELTDSPCVPASKKFQILSLLLRETAENIICGSQVSKESPAHIQTKTLLNLVNNFIHEWGKRPCERQFHLKICNFCNSVINDESQQYAKKYCCIEAEHLNRLSNEWLSLYTSQDSSICETVSPFNARYESSCGQNIPRKKECKRSRNADDTRLLSADKDSASALLEDGSARRNPHQGGSQILHAKTNARMEPRDKQQRNISDASRKVASGSGATGHHDGDPSETLTGNRSLERGKTVTSAGTGARSESDARNTGIVAERIRGKRDNNPYRREPKDKHRQARHRRARRDMEEEASRSRVAAGKRTRGGDAEDTTAAAKNAVERDNPGSGSYRYPRGREGQTRSPDNSRSDRTGKMELSGKPAKRLARHENEEPKTARRNRRRARGEKSEGERTVSLSENKRTRTGSRTTSNPPDNATRGRPVVNKEERECGGALRERQQSDQKKCRIVNNPSDPIEYRLSDERFVKLGWTLLPVSRPIRKIAQYEARPAKPNFNWFEKYRYKNTKYYNDGLTPFLRSYPDGSGEVFYRNGVLAVKVYRPENRKYDMYTVFTPGGKDAMGIEREPQILGIFDTMGNGVVFDEDGATRLSYNQIGGIFTDNPTGRPLVWTWNVNPMESILETVYTERLSDQLQTRLFPSTELTNGSGNVKTPISPSSLRNKGKKVVEVQKPVVEERQEEVGNKLNGNQNFLDIFHIKTICMKLNEFLSLRIVDRRNISLRFSSGSKSIRIELGTIVNFNKEVASYTIEATDWKSDLLRCKFQDKLSKQLDADSSLYDLAKEYRKVKRFAKEREALIAKYRSF